MSFVRDAETHIPKIFSPNDAVQHKSFRYHIPFQRLIIHILRFLSGLGSWKAVFPVRVEAMDLPVGYACAEGMNIATGRKSIYNLFVLMAGKSSD
jgi:hypothetical protein